MNTRKNIASGFAVLAAALYAINIPVAKLLTPHVSTTMLAAFLYLGAGVGMVIYRFFHKKLGHAKPKAPLTRTELPFTIGMVLLDIAAPIFLMAGLARTTAANATLLNNFEIVATTLIALAVFREVVSRHLWLSILAVAISSVILTFEGEGSFVFNQGSLFVLAACCCWGLENNCTRKISNKDSEEIVVIKGLCSGTGSLIIALSLGESFPGLIWIAATLLLGFVSYGLSINFYIMAQKDLGAAKTSAYYSIAPFLGVAFSMILLGEQPDLRFYVALAIIIFATVLMVRDSIALQHTHPHEHIHSHEHRHGDVVHTHEHAHVHEHLHTHSGGEDQHTHKHHDLSNHNHAHA